MVTAAEVGLRVIEVTAILLPLMGIFAQIFIRYVMQTESGWSDRRTRLGFLTLSLTTIAIVSAGAGAIVPFFNPSVPFPILLPLLGLYLGYLGIGLVILTLLIGPLFDESNEQHQQPTLTNWSDKEDQSNDRIIE